MRRGGDPIALHCGCRRAPARGKRRWRIDSSFSCRRLQAYSCVSSLCSLHGAPRIRSDAASGSSMPIWRDPISSRLGCHMPTCRSLSLDESNLAAADLTEADMLGASMRDADLEGAVLDRSTLVRADLSNSNLLAASLHSSWLGGTSLASAYIRADLSCAKNPSVLPGASTNFEKAAISGSSFVCAELRNSDFSDVSFLEPSDFTCADLEGSRISPDVPGAYLCHTRWSDGEVISRDCGEERAYAVGNDRLHEAFTGRKIENGQTLQSLKGLPATLGNCKSFCAAFCGPQDVALASCLGRATATDPKPRARSPSRADRLREDQRPCRTGISAL
jgi:Pentapeptide repeats (8 copies)